MIVAGFGFREGVEMSSLKNALEQAAGDAKVAAVAVPSDKARTLAPPARALGLPVVAVSSNDMRKTSPETVSQAALRAYGTGSVAEACALAAAGPGSRLIAARKISNDRMATCAIAEGGNP